MVHINKSRVQLGMGAQMLAKEMRLCPCAASVHLCIASTLRETFSHVPTAPHDLPYPSSPSDGNTTFISHRFQLESHDLHSCVTHPSLILCPPLLLSNSGLLQILKMKLLHSKGYRMKEEYLPKRKL